MAKANFFLTSAETLPHTYTVVWQDTGKLLFYDQLVFADLAKTENLIKRVVNDDVIDRDFIIILIFFFKWVWLLTPRI